MRDPFADAELLTEESIITGYEGPFVTCPDPECMASPTLQYVIKTGECFCGAGMAVYLIREEVETDG